MNINTFLLPIKQNVRGNSQKCTNNFQFSVLEDLKLWLGNEKDDVDKRLSLLPGSLTKTTAQQEFAATDVRVSSSDLQMHSLN